MDKDQTALAVLLEKKIDFLSTYAEVSMLWWVSSVVFCAAIIAGVWRYRQELLTLEKRLTLHLFALTVAVFFASIVAYGVISVWFSTILRAEVISIIDDLGIGSYGIFEYRVFGILAGIGTTSFVLILLIWLGVWVTLVREHARRS